MAPWNQPKPTTAWDVLQADGVLQFYPWRDLVFEAWGKGQLPLWNPYQLCGTPLLANSQSAPFYPLHMIFGVLHVPTGIALTVLAWFHLAWASLGARYLAKQFGAGETGSLIAGAGFGLSAFMVSWTPLASVVTTCSWIPWACALGAKLAKDRNKTAVSAIGLAVSVGMMLLGGHLQFAAYGLIGVLVVGVTAAVCTRSDWSTYLWAVGAVVIGGFLAAPQVLPAIQFSKLSHRQVSATPEGAAAYSASAISLPELTGLVVPSFTGLPGVAAQPEGFAEPNPDYWPAYIKRGAAFAEGACGIGPVCVLVLFLLNRKKLKEGLPVLLLAIIGLLLALGPLSVAMYWFVPGWSSTGSPGRAVVLAVLALCCLAGTAFPAEGAEHVDQNATRRALFGGTVVTLLTLAVAISCSSQWTPWLPGLKTAMPFAMAALTSPFPGMVSFLVAVGAFFTIRARNVSGPWIAITAALLSGPVFCLPSGQVTLTKHSEDPNIRVAFINADWGLLQAAKALNPGNLASAERIRDVAGYDSLLHKDSLEILRSIDGGKDPAPEANGNMMFVKPSFDPQQLANAGVTLVSSLKEIPQMASAPTSADGGVLTYRLPGDGRAFTPSGPARIVEDGFDHQVVQAQGPGKLTVKDRMMPGWTAEVDGHSIALPEGLWREIDLPNGPHTVRFQYSPPGLQTGSFLAAIGLTCLLACGLMTRRKSLAPDSQQNLGSNLLETSYN